MEVDFSNITTIGFDADDTLWVNETYFREAEDRFGVLMERYETRNKVDQELFKKEMDNLELYGYGIKGFVLSMVECAIELSQGNVSIQVLDEVIEIGKKMISHPVEVLDGVEEVLEALMPNYKLMVLTKGDLLDQERKLEKSGLSQYFQHVEVLSDKKEKNYENLLNYLEVPKNEFLMVGNSLKSDVLPLLNIGAAAVHIPFHTTWAHELIQNHSKENQSYLELNSIKELPEYLKTIKPLE